MIFLCGIVETNFQIIIDDTSCTDYNGYNRKIRNNQRRGDIGTE